MSENLQVGQKTKLFDGSFIPITKDELLFAIKKGAVNSPGLDGLAYEVINHLVAMDDSPLLDLFNISSEKGKLPNQWMVGLNHSISKGDQDYRPVTLTSCMCKIMVKIVLDGLLHKQGDLMPDNLYEFIKCKSTSDYVIRCLSNPNIIWIVFVDFLKDIFDRANKDVILVVLINKGIEGRLLRWIENHLFRRIAKIFLKGIE